MLDGVVVDDSELFAERLQEWEDYYNYDRPHGGLGGQTPYERLRQKTKGPEKRSSSVLHGGGSGIRTHGALRHNGFRDRPIRPLSHPSRCNYLLSELGCRGEQLNDDLPYGG